MTSIRLKLRESRIIGKEGVLYIQLIHQREVKLLATNVRVFRHEWDNKTQSIIINPSNMDRAIYLYTEQKKINASIKNIEYIIGLFDCGKDYTVSEIAQEFHGNLQSSSLITFMQNRIKQLKDKGSLRTCETYRSTLKSFLAFRNGADISFERINSSVMSDFESHLLSRGLAKNTSSFYLRILRTIYRRAVAKGLTEDRHPFADVYTGVDKTVKRAVSELVINKLRMLSELKAGHEFARDLFLFSFYTRGMSFVDLFYLKKDNIVGDILHYKRCKTGQQMSIKLEFCMIEIIKRYHDHTSEYVFPLIKPDSDKSLHLQHTSSLRLQNKRLLQISQQLLLATPLTSYVSRHTWASMAKKRGISVSIISESMGHTSEMTTKIYLAAFDQGVIDKANRSVISMKNTQMSSQKEHHS